MNSFSALVIFSTLLGFASARWVWVGEEPDGLQEQPVSENMLANKSLSISAFNIQVFGVTKISKPHVVAKLVKILRKYDITLIQEIRDSKGKSIDVLLNAINAVNPSKPYDYVISERLGRTDSKEQYAFLFRKDKVKVTGTYQYGDPQDNFERPPYAVRFDSPTTGIRDFGIIGIHTKPTAAAAEISNLTKVYDEVRKAWKLDDILIAGDFNADCDFVKEQDWKTITLKTDKRFQWLVSNCFDTTVSSTDCAYDRFVAAGKNLQEAVVPGSVGIDRFDTHYDLPESEAMDVSDHYPIYLQLEGKPKRSKSSDGAHSYGAYAYYFLYHYFTEENPGVLNNIETSASFKVKETSKKKVNDLRTMYRKKSKYFRVTPLKVKTSYNRVIADKTTTSVPYTLKLFAKEYPNILSDNLIATVDAYMKSKFFDHIPYVYGLETINSKSYDIHIECALQSPYVCEVTVSQVRSK